MVTQSHKQKLSDKERFGVNRVKVYNQKKDNMDILNSIYMNKA